MTRRRKGQNSSTREASLEERIAGVKREIWRKITQQYATGNKEAQAEKVLDLVGKLEVLIMKRERRDLSEVER